MCVCCPAARHCGRRSSVAGAGRWGVELRISGAVNELQRAGPNKCSPAVAVSSHHSVLASPSAVCSHHVAVLVAVASGSAARRLRRPALHPGAQTGACARSALDSCTGSCSSRTGAISCRNAGGTGISCSSSIAATAATPPRCGHTRAAANSAAHAVPAGSTSAHADSSDSSAGSGLAHSAPNAAAAAVTAVPFAISDGDCISPLERQQPQQREPEQQHSGAAVCFSARRAR